MGTAKGHERALLGGEPQVCHPNRGGSAGKGLLKTLLSRCHCRQKAPETGDSRSAPQAPRAQSLPNPPTQHNPRLAAGVRGESALCSASPLGSLGDLHNLPLVSSWEDARGSSLWSKHQGRHQVKITFQRVLGTAYPTF